MFKKLQYIREEIKKLIKSKTRLIVLNEDTFEEVFSFRLNLMNLFVSLSLGAIFLILITTIIIAFTPLREYIPGYASTELKKGATELAIKSDSLTMALKMNERYINAIQKVLTGKLEHAKFNKDSIMAVVQKMPSDSELEASDAEMQLRTQVKEDSKK
jgi:flagellar biosynthesis protein FliP